MKPIQAWQDAFGKQVSSTRNKLDLPAHYDLNPERYRIRENGSRVEIADATFVTDQRDTFDLEPGAGNSVSLYSAERPRYVVNYESEASFGCRADGPLTDGDVLEIGIRDYESPENKAFFEFYQNGENLASLDVVIQKNGTELKRRTVDLQERAQGFRIDNPFRPYIDFNWYGVGPYKFGLTYTDAAAEPGEKQYNKLADELSITNQTTTSDANLHLYAEYQQANAESPTIEVGSYGYILKGTPAATFRAKAARFTELDYGGSGEYEPVLAVRVDPNRANVFVDFTESEVLWNSGDGELLTISAPPSLTDADFITDPAGNGTTGPLSPPQHNSDNSVIQYTKDVTTFPDSDNNEVTTTTDPGGYQISFATSDAPQTGNAGGRATSQLQRKRPLHSDNVGILLAKRDTSQSTTINAIFETEQDW